MNKLNKYLIGSGLAFICACTDYSGDIESANDDFVKMVESVDYSSDKDYFCGDLWCGPDKDDVWDIKGGPNAGWNDTEDEVFTSKIDSDGNLLITPTRKGDVDPDDSYGVFYDFGSNEKIEDWEGICLVYQSTIGAYLYMERVNSAGAYEYLIYSNIENSQKKLKVADIPWKSFSSTSDKDMSQLFNTFEVELDIEKNPSYEDYFKIVSVGRYGTCDPDYKPKSSSSSEKDESSSSVAESSSSEVETTWCGDLWCGPTGGGLWDVPEQGSDAGWYNPLFEEGQDSTLNLFMTESKTLFAVVDYQKMEKNQFDYVEYAYDMDANVDVSDWEGFCVVYTSDLHAQLYMNGEKHYLPLPAVEDGNIVNVKWEDFTPETGEDIKDIPVKNLNYVTFTFFSQNIREDQTNYFNLISIGKYGSCKEIELK